MKCPYCSKELFRGYLYNDNQPLQWLPDGTKPRHIAYSVSEHGVTLQNHFSFFKIGGYHAEAFYCKSCHVVIAKTEE